MRTDFDIYELTEPVSSELYELSESGRLEILREDLGNRPSEAEIQAVEARVGPLPAALARFFRTVGYACIEWRAPLPEKGPGGRTHLYGRLNIPTIAEMFGEPGAPDSSGGGWRALAVDHGPLFPLDKFSAEWSAVTRPGSDRVWLCEAGMPTPQESSVTLAEWFVLGAEARFVEGWLFAKVPGTRSGPEVRRELEVYAKPLFPSLDLGRF